MASVHDDTVFEESPDDDEDPSSSDNDPEENEDVINGNEDVLNDEDDDELLEEEGEEDLNSPSSPPHPIASVASIDSVTVVPLAVPSATAVTVAAVSTAELPPDSKRQRVDSAIAENKTPPPQQLDDSRRLFQRLWTDEDEIELLQGFLNYTTLRTNSNTASHHPHHYDTALFYDQMKSKFQLDFNKNQLVEKLRRLKKKYRTVMSKISSGKDFTFKSPHDQFTFEISRKIWSDSVIKVEDNVLEYDENNNNKISLIDESEEKKNFTPKSTATKKRSRNKGVKMEETRVLNDGFLLTNGNLNDRSNNDNGNVEGFSSGAAGGGGGCGGSGGGGANITAGVVEETVRSCLTPLFKELLGTVMGGGGYGGRGISGLAMNAMPLNFGGNLNFGGSGSNGELMDERWRKLQIMELEVYSKRLELVQDQIKAALVELRSMNG